jgi:hypothetical protein
MLLLGTDCIENTVSLLLLQFVYQAIAQQCVDQIHYNINVIWEL